MKEIKAQAAKSHADKVSRMTADHAKGGKCADGGKPKGKPKTQVNVMVAPRSDGARAVPVPVPGGQAPGPVNAMPSRPVAPAGPMGAPALPQRPMPAGAPMAKKGGKVTKRARGGLVDGLRMVKGYDAGAGGGEGRLEKTSDQKRRGGK